MADRLTKEQRSKCMRNIKSGDTGIEKDLRLALWHKGYRYRKNYRKLTGKPDIVLPKYRIAIFCDSEFFHGKDWEESLLPQLQRGSTLGEGISHTSGSPCGTRKTVRAFASLRFFDRCGNCAPPAPAPGSGGTQFSPRPLPLQRPERGLQIGRAHV